MKKNFASLAMLFIWFSILTGCVSSPKVQKENVFTEVSVSECYSDYSFKNIASNGYSGISLKNATIRSESGRIVVADSLVVKADVFLANTPDFIERIEKSKKYTIYLRVESQGDFWNGYTYTPVLEKIDGLRPLSEITAEKEELQRIEAEKQAAEERAKIEKNALRDQKAKALATGYVYHGIEEANSNAKLFDSGALETGHAYFISAYMIYANGSMGGAITSLFSDPKYHYVDYISQKVKGEVVGAGQTIFGVLPVTVVIAGGKAPMHTPIILGLIE
jgi:hypothetical protein